MPSILGANEIKATGYEVANSVRFNSADSPTLKDSAGNAAPAGNRQKFTWSIWFKRCKLGVTQMLGSAAYSSGDEGYIYISGGDVLVWHHSSSGMGQMITTQLFRDTSAWYHLVWAVDTTQGTASNRMKFYINGTQVTLFSTETYPDQNKEIYWNVGGTYYPYIGRRHGGDYWDGYLAEVVQIDDAQLDADSFGEFDEDSPQIWKPKDVSELTFGTSGYHIDFEDSSDLGKDVSGVGNHFASTNLAATDQSTDTCTNNFCVMNNQTNSYSTNITFTEGNLKCTHPGVWGGAPGTFGVQNGKWYWECKVTTGNSANAFTGIAAEDVDYLDSTVYDDTGLLLYFVDGRKTVDGTDSESFFDSLATNDIVGVALDLDSGTKTCTFTKNGSASGSAVNLTANHTGKFVFPVSIGNSSSATANWEFNFGSPAYSISSGNADGNGYGNFEYSVPSGHFALCTKNLAEHG